MRTTIDVPDRLFQEAKAAAALQGRTLKDFIVDAVEQRLRGAGRRGQRVALPLVRSRSPGSVALTNDQIGRLLDGQDAGASS